MVHSYGLASSQLDRIKKAKLKLTICVDKVAASGGYMMACVGDKIIAAPFAIVGSIGVVAQMPNFNKLLKKHDIDFELLTAGEHKRTLTLFGKNTDKGREKFIEELNETHELFKEYVSKRRPNVDINKIASGEIWFGSRAKELSLVDEISTSDEYICSCFNSAKVFEIKFVRKQKLLQRVVGSVEASITRIAEKLWSRFTNPNNMSIATGRPPAVHGICGNFLFDPDTGEEVMLHDARFLRAPTLFSKYYEAGSRVAVVTAKDKLRALLGDGLKFDEGRAICFSSEKADQATKGNNGIQNASDWLGRPVPEVYSADLSEFVLAAGVKILKEWSPNVMYLSTTDYIQHKFSPNQKGAKDFYSMADAYIGELDDLGAALVVTADHGMKPKHNANGEPSVVYVQDLLDQWLGEAKARVILPITDPYVVHHGALGSFATAYLPAEVDITEITEKLSNIEGILLVINKSEAVKRFDLPPDRIGDIVIISTENMTCLLYTSPSPRDKRQSRMPSSA